MEFRNSYEDDAYAAAYAKLEFPGTYYLAFRDLPEILGRHVSGERAPGSACGTGKKALDFGCGTVRSTRFLRKLGFDAVGVDISEEMVGRARKIDPEGDYRLVADGELREVEQPGRPPISARPYDQQGCRRTREDSEHCSRAVAHGDGRHGGRRVREGGGEHCSRAVAHRSVADGGFDLVLAAFPFDNIPTAEKKIALFRGLSAVLNAGGRIVNLVSSPEIYLHEWVSFTTKDYPENRQAKCGDEVRIINLALGDPRPCVDIIWPDADYRAVYRRAGLAVVEMCAPLGRADEPYAWVNETRIAPWVVYVLGKG